MIRCCCILLLLANASFAQALNNTALDLTFPLGFDSESLTWSGGVQGLESGCTSTHLPQQIEVACALPSGNVRLLVAKAADKITLQCEEETYSCQDLESARKEIKSYTSVATRTIPTLAIEDCVLPDEPLSCVLGLINASDANVLMFTRLRNVIAERNVAGLTAVKVQIRGLDANVTSLPLDALSTLPTLRDLFVQYAALRLTNETGAVLSALKELTILDSNVPSIPDGAFIRMPNVENLMLVGDKIEEIEENAFNDLPHLVNVSLNANKLKSLPDELFSKTTLIQNIDLYDNSLTTLQTSIFSGLRGLTEVTIFANKESLKLQNGVFSNLPSLRSVDLHSTDLFNLPADLFTNSTNVRKINLSDAKLATLPEDLFSNLQLDSLDLSYNLLEVLPATLLREQKNLVKLDLSNNKLKVLPVGLFNSMNKLKTLNLSRNQIGSLDVNIFQGLTKLKELNINYNTLQKLPYAIFEYVPELKELLLAHNNLSFPCVPSPLYQDVLLTSPLNSLMQLVKVDLSYNNLEAICDDWRNLVFLSELDLSHNHIAELNNADFLGVGVTVDLRANNITSVYLRPIADDESPDLLANLLLDNNPFDCTCNLFNFITLYKDKANIKRIRIKDARCATPPDLLRHKLTDLLPDQLICDSTPCPDSCRCSNRPAKRQIELYCEEYPSYFPNVSDYFDHMYLKLDDLTDFAVLPDYVRVLNVSGLNLTEPPVIFTSMEVDLSNNYITTAPKQLLESNCSVFLSSNPFTCDCDSKESLLLLKQYEKNILDYPQMTCQNGDSIETKSTQQLCAMKLSVIISTTSIILVVLFVLLSVLSYKNIVYIRILMRKLGITFTDERLGSHEYDAFVSYAHQDENIVVPLIQTLESGSRPLKLCTHSRDWIPGELIAEQIVRSVDRSRRTIIVLSKNFINSYWAKLEFITAHSKNRVILLIIDDVHLSNKLSSDIKTYIDLTTYIHITNPYAIERLRDAVLVKVKGRELIKENGKALDVIHVDGKLVNRGDKIRY
ncbi:unnamed protein product [Leptosia nina]|uniref:TIR domain-containing protein n=1 Tax=Leptosia nina TaxID=320188 RepID=A0AAV1JIR6_9NEOP